MQYVTTDGNTYKCKINDEIGTGALVKRAEADLKEPRVYYFWEAKLEQQQKLKNILGYLIMT